MDKFPRILIKVTHLLAWSLGALYLVSCAREPWPSPKAEPESPPVCLCDSVRDSIIYIKTNPKGLPKPAFSKTSSTLPYATKVFLLADSIPQETKFEVSFDRGGKWTESNCFMVLDSVEVWGRLRFRNYASEVSKFRTSAYYQRVLVIGNSITDHGPDPEVGWYGDWGMAASSAEKDYFHIISKRLKAMNPNVDVRFFHDVNFETNYKTYDFSQLAKFTTFAPDLLIMRIAENTNYSDLLFYTERYSQYIKTIVGTSNTKVICSTSFWALKEEPSYRIRTIAVRDGYKLADLSPLQKDTTYTARGSFKNPGVAAHPSDKGMKAIADIISKEF